MKYLFVLFTLFFSLQSCHEDTSVTVNRVTPQEMRAALLQDATIQLLDVRTPTEYEASHLKSAQNICVTDSDFIERAEELDKDKPVYVYCKKGGRSAKASKILKELGFTKIYDLNGGITAWDAEGLETEN
ncbi:rhodanese-like domain-containing protein [Jejudonia soesokkakensis]|uniref:Rhodanese-like domain-containing protein n=1 Tax=Jejudonia soesokkakensis TaxID=1323432 RepID=A0ABW2MR61_9FLAO